MMKWRTLWVLGVALLIIARPAAANGLWDWMQEWSGPGPFVGRVPVLHVDCPGSSFGARNTYKNCWFIDSRHLENVKDPAKSPFDNFPIKVHLEIFEVGVSQPIEIRRLHESIRAGAGVGFLVASGDKSQGGKTIVRPTIVFPRLTSQPALTIAELLNKTPTGRARHALKIVKVHIGGELLIGPLSAEGLGVSPSASSFYRHAEYVLSKGVVVDLGEVYKSLSK